MKKLSSILSVGAILIANSAIAQDWKEWHKSNPTYQPQSPVSPQASPQPKNDRVFLDQKFVVPAGAEWNREIVATRPGIVNIQITSDSPKSITIVTIEAWQKVMTEADPDINPQKDVILVDDTDESTYVKEVQIPTGRYMIMMQNRSSIPQEFHLRCQAAS